jgi:hypothetical protein
MKSAMVVTDERTIAVEHASYRWAYLVLSYGLLLSVMYRSVMRHEASWDLLALVVLGGAVSALYQGSFRVLSRRWLLLSAAAALMALVLGVIMVRLAQ